MSTSTTHVSYMSFEALPQAPDVEALRAKGCCRKTYEEPAVMALDGG
jgi:hypothetical protein